MRAHLKVIIAILVVIIVLGAGSILGPYFPQMLGVYARVVRIAALVLIGIFIGYTGKEDGLSFKKKKKPQPQYNYN